MDMDFGGNFGASKLSQGSVRRIPTLTGSQFGTLDTPYTFSGAGEIQAIYATTLTGVEYDLINGYTITAGNIFSTPAEVTDILVDGISVGLGGAAPNDGGVHTVIFVVNAGIAKTHFWQDGAGAAFFIGQFLSIKFTDQSGSSDVITNYVFDSGSIIEQFARGSTTLKITLVNFATTDWNRYTQQRNIAHDAGTISEAWVGDDLVDFPNLISQGTGWIFDGVLHKNADDSTVYDFGAVVANTGIYMVSYTKSNHTVANPTLKIGGINWVSPYILLSDGAGGSFATLLTANASGNVGLGGTIARLDINDFSVQHILEVA